MLSQPLISTTAGSECFQTGHTNEGNGLPITIPSVPRPRAAGDFKTSQRYKVKLTSDADLYLLFSGHLKSGRWQG